MENPFEIALSCYLCGIHNTIIVLPLAEQSNDDGTVTLYYADTIHFSCPKCGQKYAIPNNNKVKTIPKQ